jgi:tetratricopeptide (TPR) repeat protein
MPIVRILLVLVALASPALAQDGARDAAAAREAAQAFRVYVDAVTKTGGRPDLTRPEVAALLGRVFDLGALNALPPAQASDIDWLLDWTGAANATNKLIILYGAKPGPQPDLAAIQRNMTEYEDQYAATMNFLIRALAREAVASNLFMASLAPQERTHVREEGLARFRSGAAEMILDAICSVILSGGKPANARLVAAAIRDTREIWASNFLPQDRARTIEQLAGLLARVPDETARSDLAAFTAALQAVDELCDATSADVDAQIADCTRQIDSGRWRGRNLAIEHYNRGIAWKAKGDLDRAIADYTEAIRLDPQHERAYVNRGNAWQAKGDLDRAIADYDEAIRLDAKDADAYDNRGIAWKHKGDLDRAIADYTEAIRLDPKDATPHYNRGIAWSRKGDVDRAVADYTAAIRLDPKEAAPYHNRGNAYASKKDYEHAVADYTEAIRLDPADADYFNARCWGRALAGKDLNGALADCNASLRLRPDDPNTFNSRGLVQLKLGAFDAAIADYDAAIARNAKDADSLYARGVAKLKTGDTAAGNADIAAATAIKPDIAATSAGYGITVDAAGANAAPAASHP